MLPSTSRAWRIFVVGTAAMSLAGLAGAQATQTKERVPGGPGATTKTVQVKGELVAKGSNWLIAKDAAGNWKIYVVQPGRKAIVDGVPKTLDQIPLGTMLTSTATTREIPMIDRTTVTTKGTVVWASATSVIVTLENGENKQYEVPSDFMFDVAGKKVAALNLKPGMKVVGAKIFEEPATVIQTDVVVTGVAPK